PRHLQRPPPRTRCREKRTDGRGQARIAFGVPGVRPSPRVLCVRPLRRRPALAARADDGRDGEHDAGARRLFLRRDPRWIRHGTALAAANSPAPARLRSVLPRAATAAIRLLCLLPASPALLADHAAGAARVLAV